MTQRVPRWAVLACAVLMSAFVLAGCAGVPAGAPQPTSHSPTSTQDPSPLPTSTPSDPIALALFGDSNSTGFSGTLDAGIAARTAWVALLPAERYTFVGGWAVDGATAAAMADAATPVVGAELVVILGGTNDLAFGVSTDVTLTEIVRIADTVGAPVVALAAIAPLDFLPDEAITLNSALAALAAERGWLFLDPWVDMRDADGSWVEEYRTDGVHTSPRGYAAAASQIARQLEAVLR